MRAADSRPTGLRHQLARLTNLQPLRARTLFFPRHDMHNERAAVTTLHAAVLCLAGVGILEYDCSSDCDRFTVLNGHSLPVW